LNAHDLHDQRVGYTQKHSWPMPYALKLLDHSENNCYPERRVHMVRVSGCEPGDGVPALRLHSSRKLQRICAVVFSRFYGSRRIKGVEVGVELRGGSPVQSLLRFCPRLPRYFAKIIFSRGVPLGSQSVVRLLCHVGL